MFIGQLFSILSSGVCGYIRIPIQRDLNRGYAPTIDIVVGGLYFGDDFSHPFELAIERDSRLYQPLAGIEDGEVITIPFEGINVPMGRASLPSRLGIGPGSHILEGFGSAGIFANELVLNLTESDFVARCVPGTITKAPLFTDDDQDGGYSVAASISLGPPHAVPAVSQLAKFGGSLTVPMEFYFQVKNHLTSMGAVLDLDSTYTLNFHNCSSEAINSLPFFVIDFGQNGRVSVHPSLLINRYPDLDNLCTVEFRVGAQTTSAWVFNPFRLPQVAMYIAYNGECRFCNEVDL